MRRGRGPKETPWGICHSGLPRAASLSQSAKHDLNYLTSAPNPQLMSHGFMTEDKGYAIVRDLLSRPNQPTALLTSSVILASDAGFKRQISSWAKTCHWFAMMIIFLPVQPTSRPRFLGGSIFSSFGWSKDYSKRCKSYLCSLISPT